MPRQVSTRNGSVPLTDITLTSGGDTQAVVLWREVALTPLAVGQWVEATHLKAGNTPDFGFKFNSSSYTEITVS